MRWAIMIAALLALGCNDMQVVDEPELLPGACDDGDGNPEPEHGHLCQDGVLFSCDGESLDGIVLERCDWQCGWGDVITDTGAEVWGWCLEASDGDTDE
jgi:hypothetical protein